MRRSASRRDSAAGRNSGRNPLLILRTLPGILNVTFIMIVVSKD